MLRSSISISFKKLKIIMRTSSVCGSSSMLTKPIPKSGCSPKTTELVLLLKNSTNSSSQELTNPSIYSPFSTTASSARILMKSKISKSRPLSPATSSKSSSKKLKRLLMREPSSSKMSLPEKYKNYSATSHS